MLLTVNREWALRSETRYSAQARWVSRASAGMSFPSISMVSSTGMAILISLVRLTSSLSTTGRVPAFFWGVATLPLVTDDAEDVPLPAVFIQGVAHGLAVDGQTLILAGISFIPALQCAIQFNGIDADEDIADDELAGDEKPAVFDATASEAPGGLFDPGSGPSRRWRG